MKTIELKSDNKTNYLFHKTTNIIPNSEYNLRKHIWHIAIISILFILLLISMKLFEDVTKVFTFETFKYSAITIIIWLCEYLILKGITNNSKLSLSLIIGFEVIYDIINYTVRTTRSSAMTISDIFAIKTALSVSKNLKFQFNIKFVFAIILVIAMITILILFRKKIVETKTNWKIRIGKILIGFAIIFVFSQTNLYKSYSLWDINETYRVLGTPITILRMFHDYNVKPPAGYNKEQIESTLKSYESTQTSEKDKPNIIVIVNESFCDYYNLYKDGNADPIEYFTKLSKDKNVISGTMYSSVFGGQTSNVEYEFLTQNSTRILPVGSYVFQQYIPKPVSSSLVEHLKSQGYRTSAMHPWESYAYSRNKIYKFFGFDSIKFKDDMEGLEKNFNNDFFSDKSTYKELLKEIHSKNKDEKLFEYVLTVQNHIGYLNSDPKQMTYSDDTHKNVYMQLIHESADALKEVIDELKKSDEKYVLLFFGDHQPNLDDSDNFIERSTEQYEVPFLIWANYDIKEQSNVKTSTIFLQNYLLKAAGIKYSTINNYMANLQKYYPIITSKFYMDSNGKIFMTDDNSSENVYRLQEYDEIDYYRIFE